MIGQSNYAAKTSQGISDIQLERTVTIIVPLRLFKGFIYLYCFRAAFDCQSGQTPIQKRMDHARYRDGQYILLVLNGYISPNFCYR